MIEPANARSDYAFVTIGTLMVALGVFDWLERRSLAVSRSGKSSLEALAAGDETTTATTAATTAAATATATRSARSAPSQSKATPRNPNSRPQPTLRLFDPCVAAWPAPAAEEYTSGGGVNTMVTLPSISIYNGIANMAHGVGSWGNHSCECATGVSHESVESLTQAHEPNHARTMHEPCANHTVAPHSLSLFSPLPSFSHVHTSRATPTFPTPDARRPTPSLVPSCRGAATWRG